MLELKQVLNCYLVETALKSGTSDEKVAAFGFEHEKLNDQTVHAVLLQDGCKRFHSSVMDFSGYVKTTLNNYADECFVLASNRAIDGISLCSSTDDLLGATDNENTEAAIQQAETHKCLADYILDSDETAEVQSSNCENDLIDERVPNSKSVKDSSSCANVSFSNDSQTIRVNRNSPFSMDTRCDVGKTSTPDFGSRNSQTKSSFFNLYGNKQPKAAAASHLSCEENQLFGSPRSTFPHKSSSKFATCPGDRHTKDCDYDARNEAVAQKRFPVKPSRESFSTARKEFLKSVKQNKRHVPPDDDNIDENEFVVSTSVAPVASKRLGLSRAFSAFRPPVRKDSVSYPEVDSTSAAIPADLMSDGILKSTDPKLVELVLNEIMDSGAKVTYDDIAGLTHVKSTIMEIVVYPLLRPDIFTGLRAPAKGLLLFGPPGTGKTLIGKCIACQAKATFFNISASSLMSKWVGEGEKMVRTLFAVARCRTPAVIFIDEVDSLLSRRCEDEHESSRRVKTEFLVQLDGAGTKSDERLLIVGATNRPQEIDEAARRRFVKRLYVPLPDQEARLEIMRRLLADQKHSLTSADFEKLASLSEGYSGADVASLCKEAAMGPIRSIMNIECISADEVEPILLEHFLVALKQVKATVAPEDLDVYVLWDKKFGCSSAR